MADIAQNNAVNNSTEERPTCSSTDSMNKQKQDMVNSVSTDGKHYTETQGRYLMIECSPDRQPSYVDGVLLYCHVPGIIPMKRAYRNEQAYWLYDKHGRLTLEQCLHPEIMQAEECMQLLKNLGDCCLELENYLLSSEELWLDESLIFRNVDGKWLFLYFPGNQVKLKEQVRSLLEMLAGYLQRSFQHMDDYIRASQELIAKLQNQLDNSDAINWNLFRDTVLETMGRVHSQHPMGVHEYNSVLGGGPGNQGDDFYEDGYRDEDGDLGGSGRSYDYEDDGLGDDPQALKKGRRRGRRWMALRGALVTLLITVLVFSAFWLWHYV